MSSIFRGNEKFINFSLLYRAKCFLCRFGGWLMSFSFSFRQSIQVFIVSPLLAIEIMDLFHFFSPFTETNEKRRRGKNRLYTAVAQMARVFILYLFYHELEFFAFFVDHSCQPFQLSQLFRLTISDKIEIC